MGNGASDMGANVSSEVESGVQSQGDNSSSSMQQLRDSVSTNMTLTISGSVFVSALLVVFLIAIFGIYNLTKIYQAHHHERISTLEAGLAAKQASEENSTSDTSV